MNNQRDEIFDAAGYEIRAHEQVTAGGRTLTVLATFAAGNNGLGWHAPARARLSNGRIYRAIEIAA